MSTEWTAERLAALAEHVVIEYKRGGLTGTANRRHSAYFHWIDEGGEGFHSSDVYVRADPGSIRVVSVPIDALLTDDAIEAARWHSGLGGNRYSIERMLRAAIGHVTGGAA